MQKTIFTALFCGLMFVAVYAGVPSNNNKVDEAYRYRAQQNTSTVEVATANAMNFNRTNQEVYLPVLLNGSSAQLEALGSRYAFAKSNSQLDELGSRYAFAKSNSQLDELGSRYAFAKSNSQLDELGSRYAFAKSNSQLDELGSRYAFAKSNSQLDELGSRYAFAK